MSPKAGIIPILSMLCRFQYLIFRDRRPNYKLKHIERGGIIIRLTENVWQFGNRHFNIFVVGQTEGAIIECAVTGGVYNFRQQWKQWNTQPDIRYLFISHAHFDHVCGVPELQAMFPEADVCSSMEAQRLLGKAKIMDNFFAQDEEMTGVLAREGIVPEGLASPQIEPISIDRVIEGGEQLKLKGDVTLQVIDALGHSPCSLAFYLPQEQVMFIGDAGGFQISDDTIFPIFFQDYRLFIETLQRLSGYPTRILATPHEKIWLNHDIPAFYDRALNAAQTAFVNIERMLDQGWAEADILDNLFSHYYRGNLRIYTTVNIRTCVELLLRRVKECL